MSSVRKVLKPWPRPITFLLEGLIEGYLRRHSGQVVPVPFRKAFPEVQGRMPYPMAFSFGVAENPVTVEKQGIEVETRRLTPAASL